MSPTVSSGAKKRIARTLAKSQIVGKRWSVEFALNLHLKSVEFFLDAVVSPRGRPDTENYGFLLFRLNVATGVLWRETVLVPLRPKTCRPAGLSCSSSIFSRAEHLFSTIEHFVQWY